MSQFLSKDWNVSMSAETDVLKVYDPMFSKVMHSYKSKAKLHLSNPKMPINLFNKIIINDEHEIDIIKKDDMLSLFYPEINQIIPITNKDKVEIPLFNINIETIMKIELITLNKVRNICYLFCPFYHIDDISTFKSTFIMLNEKEPRILLKEKISVKTVLISNNKIKEIKEIENLSSIFNNEDRKNKFSMISVIHNKTKYIEHHLIKSLDVEKDAIFSE